MKHRVGSVLVLVLVLGVGSLVAASNLNLSKSNINRLTYSTTLVTPAQAAAILAELDKTPGMDEAAVKRALPTLLKKNGVDPARVKKMLVRPGAGRKGVSIILLDRPEDEPAAIAVSDEGAPGPKAPVKGKKTN